MIEVLPPQKQVGNYYRIKGSARLLAASAIAFGVSFLMENGYEAVDETEVPTLWDMSDDVTMDVLPKSMQMAGALFGIVGLSVGALGIAERYDVIPESSQQGVKEA